MSEELIQGSPEWHQLRLGRVTASRMSDLTAKTKTGYGASRANYLAELIIERLTGQPLERFTNAAMAWGTEKEPDARDLYAFTSSFEVTQVGFVHHPRIQMAGASPDGFVGEIGMLECKCPNSSTHIDTLLTQTIPDKYVKQMAWQLACCPNRQWVDFVSYDPRLPDHMRLWVKRYHRDDKFIAELEKEVHAFLAELDEKLASLNALFAQSEVA